MNITTQLPLLELLAVVSPDPKMCPTVTQTVNYNWSITWYTTKSDTLEKSVPFCLDENFVPLYRFCKQDGSWDPEPDCKHVQALNLPKCPENFGNVYVDGKDYCYAVLPPAPFPNKCPYPNEEEAITNRFQKSKPDTSFWLPVLRDDDETGVGDYYSIEKSFNYGLRVEISADKVENLVKKRCMAVKNGVPTIVHCDDRHSRSCFYKTRSNNTIPCKEYFVGMKCAETFSGNTDYCVCLDETETQNPRASYCQQHELFEPREPYQNEVRNCLGYNPVCWIGFERDDSAKYVWSSTRTPIDYAYWSLTTKFEHRHGVIKINGWDLRADGDVRDEILCALCKMKINYRKPTMELSLRESGDVVELVLSATSSLKVLNEQANQNVYCFFRSGEEETKERIDNLVLENDLPEGDSKVYTFNVLVTGPGIYWCEGFAFPDLQMVSSNMLLYNDRAHFGNEYVATVTLNYLQESNPLHHEFYITFRRYLVDQLLVQSGLRIRSVRRFKVLGVDEESFRIRYLLHVGMTASSRENDFEEEHGVLKNSTETAIMGIEGELDYFASCDFCLKVTTISNNLMLEWPTSDNNRSVLPVKTCVRKNGRLVSRRCHGDFVHGARWSDVSGECSLDTPKSQVTQELNSLLEDDLPTEQIVEALANITKSFDGFEEVDIHLIGQIIGKIAADYEVDAEKVTTVISNVIDVDREVLADSQSLLNATDTILKNYDNLLIHAGSLENESHVLVSTKNLINLAFDPKRSDVIGLALFVKFNETSITILDQTTSIDDLLEDETLEGALWFDKKLIEQILWANKTKLLIVTAFMQNSLFNEQITQTGRINDGIVFGVILPGFDEKFLAPISLFIKSPGQKALDLSCSHWQFDISSHWLPSGTINITNTSQLVGCEFWHATHFGLLLTENIPIKIDTTILNIMTALNCGLSLFGLLVIFFTAAFFKDWRQRPGNRVLLNFSLAIFLQIVFLYASFSFGVNGNPEACVFFGAFLHYSVMAGFCWTLVLGVLQFKRLVLVMGAPTRHLLLKSYVAGWILPLVPVILLLASSPENYEENGNICYPSDLGLLLTVVLPITVILSINFVVFAKIILVICKNSPESGKKTNRDLLYQWRMVVLLFFTLGLTWVMGLLTYFDDDGAAFFVYPFCFLVTLQGFVLFLFFIVFNKMTRNWYNRLLCPNLRF